MYEYGCIINKVIDGDTVDVDIDLGFGVWLSDQRIRLIGIDAPETRTRDLEEKKAGLESKEFVESLLPIGTHQVLKSYQFTGKYGRILGSFHVYDSKSDRWTDLCNLLLEEGYAVKYGEENV